MKETPVVQRSDKDTGSPEAQISRLTARIEHLSGHFSEHKKDNHSKRGLLRLVALRRKLLKYLHRTNPARYFEVVKALGLRHKKSA